MNPDRPWRHRHRRSAAISGSFDTMGMFQSPGPVTEETPSAASNDLQDKQQYVASTLNTPEMVPDDLFSFSNEDDFSNEPTKVEFHFPLNVKQGTTNSDNGNCQTPSNPNKSNLNSPIRFHKNHISSEPNTTPRFFLTEETILGSDNVPDAVIDLDNIMKMSYQNDQEKVSDSHVVDRHHLASPLQNMSTRVGRNSSFPYLLYPSRLVQDCKDDAIEEESDDKVQHLRHRGVDGALIDDIEILSDGMPTGSNPEAKNVDDSTPTNEGCLSNIESPELFTQSSTPSSIDHDYRSKVSMPIGDNNSPRENSLASEGIHIPCSDRCHANYKSLQRTVKGHASGPNREVLPPLTLSNHLRSPIVEAPCQISSQHQEYKKSFLAVSPSAPLVGRRHLVKKPATGGRMHSERCNKTNPTTQNRGSSTRQIETRCASSSDEIKDASHSETFPPNDHLVLEKISDLVHGQLVGIPKDGTFPVRGSELAQPIRHTQTERSSDNSAVSKRSRLAFLSFKRRR